MSNNSFIKNLLTGINSAASRLVNNPYREVNISWLKLKILKHLPAGKLRHHNLSGKKVYFTNAQEFLFGLKEIFIDKSYYQQLPPNPVIIDCGSNIGLSIIYIKKLYPGATVTAFEPDEKNFELLQKNVNSFQLNNVTLHKSAVWINNEPLQFSVTGTMGSSITTATEAGKTVTVQGFRLKDLLTTKVDFLKIDIEGAEYEVLKDIAPQLQFVNNLFIEYHGTYHQNNELIEMLSILETNGFHFYIKEATSIYDHPFSRQKRPVHNFDVQLNIFCIRRLA